MLEVIVLESANIEATLIKEEKKEENSNNGKKIQFKKIHINNNEKKNESQAGKIDFNQEE